MTDERPMYKVSDVVQALALLVPHIAECFSGMIVCGYMRRGEVMTPDVGIVTLPKDDMAIWNLNTLLANTDSQLKLRDIKSKEKTIKFKMSYHGDYTGDSFDDIPVDIFLASGPRPYEVMKLVRTGPYTFLEILGAKGKEKNCALRYGYNDEWKQDLYGLYGAHHIWVGGDLGHYQTILNPKNLIAWTEVKIVEHVFGKYIEPKDRSQF